MKTPIKSMLLFLVVSLLSCGGPKERADQNEMDPGSARELDRQKVADVKDRLDEIENLTASDTAGTAVSGEGFKLIPCVRKEYYIPPGESRTVEFSQLTAGRDDWKLVESATAGERDVYVRLEDVSAQSVWVELWAVDQNRPQSVIRGVATRYGANWFYQKDEYRYVLFMTDLPLQDYFFMSEDAVLDRLQKLPGLGTALDNGTLSLTGSSETLYITSFRLMIEAPADSGEKWPGGFEILLTKEKGSEPALLDNALAQKYKILVQRYSTGGNYVISGAHFDASCLQ